MAEPASLPTRTGTRKFLEVLQDPDASFASVLQHPEMQRRMASALPRHLNPERMIRVCALALQKTPKLADCDRASVLGAMLVCGSLGWEPNTPLGHAHLIPYGKVCQLVPGYQGLVDLAERTGKIKDIHADVVYPGDEFDFWYGVGATLKHRPTGDRTMEWTHAYCVVELTNGGHRFEVMTRGEVLLIRNRSQGYIYAKGKGGRTLSENPWVAHEPRMAAKTAIRRLAKYKLPISVEFATAAALDDMADAGRQDLSALTDATDITWGVQGMAIDDDQDGTPAAPTAGDAGGAVSPQAPAAQAAGGASPPQPAPPAVDRAHTGHTMPNTTGPGINLADQPVSMLASIKAGIDSSHSAADLENWWQHVTEPPGEGEDAILDGLSAEERGEARAYKLAREELLNKRSRGRG